MGRCYVAGAGHVRPAACTAGRVLPEGCGPHMCGPYRVAGFLLYVAMVSGHGAVKTPPHKFSTAEAYILYAPALGSNNAAARYAKYSAKHIHPCPRFSLCLHSGGSNSTSAMAAQTGTS